MARIFISYSRVDTPFVERLYYLLQRLRPSDQVWYDQAPDGLLGGDSWWEVILDAIADCDVFIYVLSNESVQSKYCQAEFEEARRLQKRIITIQARDRTDLVGELRDIHYVDMKDGVDDPDALARLGGALDRQLKLAQRRRPLWKPRTPKPAEETISTRPADAPDVDTPALRPPVRDRNKPDTNIRAAYIMGCFGLIGVVIAGIFGLWQGVFANGGDDNQPPETPIAQPGQPVLPETQAWLDYLGTVQHLPTNTPPPTITQTPSITPNATGTYTAAQTRIAQTVMAGWTDTPAPSNTPRPTDTLQPTATTPATPTTPDPLQTALERAQNFSGSNDDWEPFVQDFDGVEMVLVPEGCFEMGSTEEQVQAAFEQCQAEYDNCDRVWFEAEYPQHTVCFEEPFWIDRYEVTNAQFAAFLNAMGNQSEGGATWLYADDEDVRIHQRDGTWVADDGYGEHPAIDLSWYGASAYCEWRDARLPTEAEWEYAARGPDALEYPWGDEFNGDYVVRSGNSDGETAPVGSRPAGVSWVGAQDLSGNVWEWVADWYDAAYYGTLAEGVVNPTGPETGEYRVLRGGSWFNNDSLNFRAACRYRFDPHYGYDDWGFRCARSR